MKTSALARPAIFALVLSLGGCFGGNDSEDDPAGPGIDPDRTSNLRKLAPGLYEGDYTAYDSIYGLESEFLLNEDGSYRFFWFTTNTVVADIRGNWFQRDSNVHFNGIREAYVDGGIFYPGLPIEDDTNAVRQITETSFIRKEWTPLRQKPFWINYRRKTVNPLGDGTFRFSQEYPVDSSTSSQVRIGISLDGNGYSENFLQTFAGDTVRAWLAEADWHQVGSVFVIERYAGQLYDSSSHVYGPDWDSIPGAMMQRIKDVSDTAFKIWAPGNPGTWDEYRKD
jgi:hypothetical protein